MEVGTVDLGEPKNLGPMDVRPHWFWYPCTWGPWIWDAWMWGPWIPDPWMWYPWMWDP